MTIYNIGDSVNIANTFTFGGIVTDPATLVLTVTDPDGGVTTYNYPSPETITRDNVGQYHVDVTAGLSGTWKVEWKSTGAVVSDIVTGFYVSPALESIQITVNDQNTNPIVGANVQVYQDPLTILVGGVTNSSGIVAGSVLPGSYTVEITNPKTVFANPYAIVVEDDGGVGTQDYTLTGTVLSIPETAQPTKVRLFGNLIGVDGHYADGVRVQVSTEMYGAFRPYITPGSGSDPGVAPANVMVRAERRELVTDANGYWEIDVIADSIVRVEIPDVRFMKLFRVPNDPRTTILNIADARSDPGPGNEIGITSDRGVLDDTVGSS